MTQILWESTDSQSVEYFHLVADNAYVFEGTVVMRLDMLLTRITYTIECDKAWNTRAVVIHQERPDDVKRLTLKVSEEQIWQTDGSTMPFTAGIHDVDLEITPSTNTLPIRRLDLKVGESQQVDAVWVRFPSLTLERLHQRYTRIGQRLYKYENPLTGYEAQLEVDEFGLVVFYDGLWHRVSA